MDNEHKLIAIANTVDIVTATARNFPAMHASDVPGYIAQVHAAVTALYTGTVAQAQADAKQEPAVPIRKSVTPDYVVCLDCGEKGRSLKRHLSSKHNLTPETYRAKWGLAADHVIVAPNYSTRRSELAKQNGLGRK